MRTLSTAVALVVALAAMPPAHAQKATEQFIPIGQSPGASGKITWIGEIVSTDARARTLTVSSAQGPRTVKLTDKTRIFLDRSKSRQSNLSGSFADLQAGRRAEVKPEEPASTATADWVKVEVSP